MGEARLTTHVLDLTAGRPAAGMALVLSRLGDGGGELVRARLNADGRTDGPLLQGDALVPGRYELLWSVGSYFGGSADTEAAIGEGPAGAPYLDEVPIRFGVAEGVGHLHVALLVTPWSYTTYRGS
jgi:5-hydroxyisourate hydrolase